LTGGAFFTGPATTGLEPDVAPVFDRWQLTRDKDTPPVLLALPLKKTAARSRIIQDHASRAR
jgi:hypothetical protein